ncbi:hypothetical protein SKAU_G00415120 [Synaphobranchus kaupii]|uniref:Uncharacterized protein n=1 Tax=Synaphobranchus kaupii TaxID=118154 RepID=A0A9Q1E793_SYNKA|nr:hypothetical protein SKAU_G00415120 [Synaphobranchus kaupii]
MEEKGNRALLKREIKSVVWDKLVELKIFALPIILPPTQPDVSSQVPGGDPESPLGTGGSAGTEVKDETPPATLPRFEAFSPSSFGSRADARLKVRLARL